MRNGGNGGEERQRSTLNRLPTTKDRCQEEYVPPIRPSIHPAFVQGEEMMINCTLIRVNSNVSARYGDIKFN